MKVKDTIKVIIKNPGEKVGHSANIKNSLYILQHTVGGPIEPIDMGDGNFILCNEEARIRGMDYNFTYCYPYEVSNGSIVTMQVPLFGPVIICGVDGEDFTDAKIGLSEWSDLLHEWKN
jgi:hypothetical protein